MSLSCTLPGKKNHSIFTVTSSFIADCIPVQSWQHLSSAASQLCRLTQVSVWSPDNMHRGVGIWVWTSETQSNVAYHMNKKVLFPMVKLHASVTEKRGTKVSSTKQRICWGKGGNENETMQIETDGKRERNQSTSAYSYHCFIWLSLWYCSTLGGSIGSPLVV